MDSDTLCRGFLFFNNDQEKMLFSVCLQMSSYPSGKLVVKIETTKTHLQSIVNEIHLWISPI